MLPTFRPSWTRKFSWERVYLIRNLYIAVPDEDQDTLSLVMVALESFYPGEYTEQDVSMVIGLDVTDEALAAYRVEITRLVELLQSGEREITDSNGSNSSIWLDHARSCYNDSVSHAYTFELIAGLVPKLSEHINSLALSDDPDRLLYWLDNPDNPPVVKELLEYLSEAFTTSDGIMVIPAGHLNPLAGILDIVVTPTPDGLMVVVATSKGVILTNPVA